MAVDPKALKAALKKDNPTYERVLKSDLHNVVDVACKSGVAAKALAAEMRLVKDAKWVKYKNTRAYLLHSVPGLDDIINPKLVSFGTGTIAAAPNGGIKHKVVWSSSSGNLADLLHVKVREHVWWAAPSSVTKALVDATYKSAGEHNGMGGATLGTQGYGTDEHTGLGPFTNKIFDATLLPKGTVAELVLDQAYQMSVDGGPWQEIPNSRFKLRRRVTLTDAGKVRIEMLKKGLNNPAKLSNVHQFK